MSVSSEKNRLVEVLEDLTGRLSAPDLTAAESRDLRPRLLGLLESLERERGVGPRSSERAIRSRGLA